MSNVAQISSYATYMTTVRNLSRNQTVINDLSTQMSSEKKAVDLAAFGPQTRELLDLRAEMLQRENFISNIDTAVPRVKAYDRVLTRLADIASEGTSNTVMPWGPGPARIGITNDADPSRMKVAVNSGDSHFKVAATYTVTAVPSPNGPEGSFDIAVSDGMGGSAVRTLNLQPVPPDDGYHRNFTIAGGPGDGTVISLDIKNLTKASTSTFSVEWPDLGAIRERVDGTLGEIRALLNERIGDRYLFSGARLATEPVRDLTDTRQVTKVTLNGTTGDANDVYSVVVDGRRFSYRTQGLGVEKDLGEIARNLTDQMNAADPALPVYATLQGNVITLTGKTTGQQVKVDAAVRNGSETLNSVSGEQTLRPASSSEAQISTLKFNGPDIDIGDRFGFTVAMGEKGHFDYREYPVDFAVSAGNIKDMPGVARMDMVSTRLVEKINNAAPALPFTAALRGTPGNYSVDIVGTKPGQSFTVAPHDPNGSIVNSMTVATLPPGATSTTFQDTVRGPGLPDYDNDFTPSYENRTRPEAWAKSSLTVEEGLEVTYGVVSTDPGFQTLIRAFRYARAAVDNPGDYTQHMAKAKELLTQAKHDIRDLHSKVSVDQSSLEISRRSHTEKMSDLANRLAAIEGIDQTEVATRLRQAMTTQEATYTIAGQVKKLSLVNFMT